MRRVHITYPSPFISSLYKNITPESSRPPVNTSRVTDYRHISFTTVCANCFSKRKLIPWLKLILRNQTLLESSYHSWSYTVSTGMYE